VSDQPHGACTMVISASANLTALTQPEDIVDTSLSANGPRLGLVSSALCDVCVPTDLYDLT
jgi:hypothetical protein